jgi:hypothetical protein
VTVSVGDKKVQTEIPSKGDWNTYSEVEAGELELAAGKQALRLTINTNYINIDWIKFVDESVQSSSSVPQSSSSATLPVSSSSAPAQSSSSATNAIVQKIAFEHGSAMVRCQVFDLNGQLVKSANVMAGSASEAWNLVKSGLRNGAYIMRYGEANHNAMRIVQLRK